ncbi:PilZ domain-containing protein [Alteromonas sp. C1M14]|uniref:PilZ domain-containing protein n=1 Tax=Alteromonas sp. C1M14 TaxID=2841567 RepID=UPI001C0900F4|nr:PilZ domain-containing protein [Alteromonas sp. C1M14]
MDKRQFQRVALNVSGQLSHRNVSIPIVIKDVSLQGLRLCASDRHLDALPFDSHDPYTVIFKANEDSPDIALFLQQLYRQTQTDSATVDIGCKLDHIDVESLAGLRRLITMNSEDNTISEKDLNALIDAIYGKASNASDN